MTGKAILLAFIAALVMKFFFLDFMIAEGNSMAPAIENGAILTVNKASYGIRLPWSSIYLLQWGGPKEGDVVIFYTPTGEVAVKRCGEILTGGFYYLFGDNSSQSYDSRNYGPVPITHIIGRVLGK
jgi:signal peptidase I